MNGRLLKVQSKFDENRINSFLVTAPASLRYLTGFSGTSGVAVVRDDGAVFITDFRYREQAEGEVNGFRIEIAEDEPLFELGSLSVIKRGDRLGFEAENLSVYQYRRLEDLHPDVEFVPVEGLMKSILIVKEPSEVDSIRRAVEISGLVFDETLGSIRPGVSEREIAAEIVYKLKRRGSEGIPFDPIVASGERAAMPHARVSDKLIQLGDLVVMDFGAIVDGYASDMTRTVVMGRPSQKQGEIYGLVARAQQVAIDHARAGISCSRLDGKAREVIAEAGYGPNFGHSLGHGIGLEVHQNPRISAKNQQLLQPGMVVTIEPGIYIPGWGGVRIEDVVLICEEGCEVLTSASKGLISIH